MIGAAYSGAVLARSSSGQRRISAFDIDELLGLSRGSRRDVIVTSLPPSHSQSEMEEWSDEVQRRRQRPPQTGVAVTCCCRGFDVHDCRTDCSSDAAFTAPRSRPSSATSPTKRTADADVGRSDTERRQGRTFVLTLSYCFVITCIFASTQITHWWSSRRSVAKR